MLMIIWWIETHSTTQAALHFPEQLFLCSIRHFDSIFVAGAESIIQFGTIFKFGIAVYKFEGVFSGNGEKFGILDRIGILQFRESMLTRSEKFTASSVFEVCFGYFKTVLRFFQSSYPAPGFLR